MVTRISAGIKKSATPVKKTVGSKTVPSKTKTQVKAAPATTNKRPARRGADEEAPVKKGAFGRPATGSTKRAAPKRKPAPKIVFKAPKEVKSFFVEFNFATAKDGFIDPASLEVTAIKGKWDNENAPRYDLLALDPQTAAAIIGRFSLKIYAANILKRLPVGKEYSIILRVSVSTRDHSVRCGVKTAFFVNAKGKLQEFVDKRDPEYRKIRGGAKFMAGAFTNVADMATLKELDAELASADSEEEDDED